MPDFLYDNAPLIEVIAEVRWTLVQLKTVPDGSIDPFFPAVAGQVREALKGLGYTEVERLAPEEVPLELLGSQPVFRYRTRAGKWPLYQLGPGIFTCNIVPEYDGWAAFRKVISEGLGVLFAVDVAPKFYPAKSGVGPVSATGAAGMKVVT